MTEAVFQLDPPDSVIITLEPSEADRDALLVPDGVSEDRFHLTLVRVGDISEMPKMAEIIGVMLDIAGQASPLVGEVSGMGFFGADGFAGNTVALVDVDGIATFRTMLADALAAAKMPVDETYDFIPHITLAEGPVAQPEAKVGRSLLFQRMGLRFGPQVVLIPFGLPMVTETGEEVEIDEQPVAEVMEPVPVAEVAGPNTAAVDRLMERLKNAVLAEFEVEPVEDAEELGFIQGPDGKLRGSEKESGGEVDGPEDPIGGGPADPLGAVGFVPTPPVAGRFPFADEDKGAALDPAGDWDNLDPSGDQQTVESVFMSGGEIDAVYTQATSDGGMGMVPLDDLTEQGAEQAYESVSSQLDELATPAPADIAITTTASMGSYEYNPETGKLAGKYAEQDTLPLGSTPPVIVGYGNPNAALGEAAAAGDMAVQITVTAGTPIINGGVGQVAEESAGTAVALPSSAKVTITGQTINPATGQPMLLATATPYEPGEARWR